MFKNLKNDIPASIVVFFVALPLCLGIALASDAPPFSGLIAGIIGGIIVGALSGSKIGVSGPAAGLAAIVAVAISQLGYQNFLVAVVLGGVIQIVFGILRFGIIGYYFPSAVIKGMLTGIGIIIILKEIPLFFGIEGKLSFFNLAEKFGTLHIGATVIGVISLAILLFWSNILAKKAKIFTIIQGPLIAVIVGIIYYVVTTGNATLSLTDKLLVSVPVPDSLDDFKAQFITPNFSAITNIDIWITGFTIALVASLETLLCVEATDKIDPNKNVTPTNRELFAQGTGNIVSGLIGGLPITQVIVRSSANIQSGGRSKMSAIIHGFLLLISVIAIPNLLNKIPLSVLAAILLIVGYKLAKPALFVKMFKLGWKQFVPFILTVVGIVFIDLLKGIGIGVALALIIVFVLHRNFKNSSKVEKEGKKAKLKLSDDLIFFKKATILKTLNELEAGTHLEIDATSISYLDNDFIEIFEDFKDKAQEKDITITLITSNGSEENPTNFNSLITA